jgi:hypothetical protein
MQALVSVLEINCVLAIRADLLVYVTAFTRDTQPAPLEDPIVLEGHVGRSGLKEENLKCALLYLLRQISGH